MNTSPATLENPGTSPSISADKTASGPSPHSVAWPDLSMPPINLYSVPAAQWNIPKS